MADLTYNVPGLDIDVPGLAYDVQGLTSEVPGLRPGQTRPNLSPDHIIRESAMPMCLAGTYDDDGDDNLC